MKFDDIPTAIQTLLNEVAQIKTILSNQQPANDYLSISEACDFLNLAKPTLYGFVSQKKIPNIKRGKKIYFKKSDLVEYLEKGIR